VRHAFLTVSAWIFLTCFCPRPSLGIELPSADANDNRTAAGVLADGTLTLQLDLVETNWFPEMEPGPSIRVYSFAERGRAPQIPGPLIRVPQGTKVHANIHNSLPVTVFLRGFQPHTEANAEPHPLAAGATIDLNFEASAAGTFYYSALSTKESIHDVGVLPVSADLPMGEGPFEIESQLNGAFIVDPPGGPTDDRIFVLTVWMRGVIHPPFREVPAINGKSWPYTEHLSQRVGDTIRWRVLNPSMSDHAMHLHGFYFQVNSLGDGEHDHAYSSEETHHAVTQYLVQGATTSLTWTAERSGQWLFHCHMTAHMSPELSLMSHPLDAKAHAEHAMTQDSAGMGGLILGIRVAPAEKPTSKTSEREARKLRLLIRDVPGTRFAPPGMGYLIQDTATKEAPGIPPVPGEPLVLTRDEPVEITIVNQLKETTAVHWHGIELESYYDGVPGWSGESAQTTPPIPPGGTFVARMTPPRAGTFIYHTHWHDDHQLMGGLYGPLIVLDPGEKFDPETNKIFILGRAGPDGSRDPLLLNGLAQPRPLTLKAGTRYRFRFVNIATNDSDASIALLDGGQMAEWRAIAKDGWTLPGSQATIRSARQAITVGETYDFEFVSQHRGKLMLEVTEGFLETKISQTIAVH